MQKISIKREQSQAGLSFAERKKFRPQVKNKLLLLLALLLTAATGAWAQGPWTSGACTVTFSDGVMTVSGTGAMADYKDSYELPWYSYCFDTKTIVIESGVTGIGNSAFAKCSNLESVSIPASVTSIGRQAFEDCGSEATTAPTVSFAEGSTPLTIGEYAFNYSNLTSINIPNRVTSIGERAFNSCSNLESVSIPASVTSISEEAFRNCSMLAKVYIYAPSLTTYGANAFQSNATGRKIYVLPEAVDTYKAGWSAYAADIEAMTLYATSVKEGTVDADKWTISPNPAPEGSPVTVKYTGRLKVKGVKATSEAAAKPDLLPAVFTVDAGKTVNFSKGNLQATYNGSSWIWGFAEHQWDYIGNAAGNTSINGNGTVSANGTVDLFGWVGASSTWTGAAQYGISNSTATNNVDGYGNVGGEAQKVGWGATVGEGWRTLTKNEWLYLLSTRETGVTVNSTDNARYTLATINTDGTAVKGLIIFPDSYAGGSPAGVTWGTINAKSYFETTCTSAGWTALEAAGCVFLPAAGYREASNVTDAGIGAGYWSSSSSNATYAFALYFESDYMNIQYIGSRKYGFSVRLVQATSDAAPEVTYTLLSAATTSDCGKVVCAAGHLHDAKTAVPDGCTAVGILGKVTETGHGLILALQNATAQNWNTINGWTSVTTYAGTTLKALPDDDARGTNLTSYTALGETAVSNWAVAQKSDYEAIFTNLGSKTADSDGTTYDSNVDAYITTGVGGTAISDESWSATEYDSGRAWDFQSRWWAYLDKNYSRSVRPVLGFGGEADEQAAKPAATVTEAPTGAAVVGVGKTTALVSGGVADGGTLMYAVTTTDTKPTSTDGFSDAVPTAQTITASGKVYVWYYVKADDTHSDSEIAATAIEVPVADIVWDASNVTDIDVEGTYMSYTKEGITLSANDGEDIYAMWNDNGDPKTDGISFQVYALGGFTFTAPTGKEFTKIEMNAVSYDGWDEANLGEGWTYFEDETKNIYKVTWTGSAASTDKLLPLTEDFIGENVKSIGFYLVDAE